MPTNPTPALKQRQIPVTAADLLEASSKFSAIRILDAHLHDLVIKTFADHGGDLRIVLTALLQHAALIISRFPSGQREPLEALAVRHLEESVAAHVKHDATEPAGGM